jgi:hypothetical protein
LPLSHRINPYAMRTLLLLSCTLFCLLHLPAQGERRCGTPVPSGPQMLGLKARPVALQAYRHQQARCWQRGETTWVEVMLTANCQQRFSGQVEATQQGLSLQASAHSLSPSPPASRSCRQAYVLRFVLQGLNHPPAAIYFQGQRMELLPPR